jgi:hypothetical protein
LLCACAGLIKKATTVAQFFRKDLAKAGQEALTTT